jgi:hypothetical protein
MMNGGAWYEMAATAQGTILRAQGRDARATKIHTAKEGGGWDTVGWGGMKHFAAAPFQAGSLRELMTVLEEAARDPRALLVAEVPAPGADWGWLQRRIHGEGAGLRAGVTGSRWVCWEVDGVEDVPEEIDPRLHPDRDAEFLKWWLTRLPGDFARASTVLQWSSSALVKGKISFHAFQWLSRWVSRESIHAYMEAHKHDDPPHWRRHVDTTIWDGARVHYIADPVFFDRDGQRLPDPLAGRRWQWVQGEVEEAEPPAEWVDQGAWEEAVARWREDMAEAKERAAVKRAELLAEAQARKASGKAGEVGASGDETGGLVEVSCLGCPVEDLDPKRVLAWARKAVESQAAKVARATVGERHALIREAGFVCGNVLAGLEAMGWELDAAAATRVDWQSGVSAVERAVEGVEREAVAVGGGDADRARVFGWALRIGKETAVLPDYRLQERYRPSVMAARAQGGNVVQMRPRQAAAGAAAQQRRVVMPAYDGQPALEVTVEVDSETGEVMEGGPEAEAGAGAGKKGRKRQRPPQGADLRPVRGAWFSAPAHEAACIPARYIANPDGRLMKLPRFEDDDLIVVAMRPIIITGRMVTTQGAEHLRLSWMRDGRWSGRTVPREVAMDRSKLVGLAKAGAPINTTNAALVVDWLTEYEDLNDACIPRASVSDQMGWHGEEGGPRGFLLGSRWVDAQGVLSDASPEDTATWQGGVWMFEPGGDGDRDEAAAVARTRGTMAGWREAMQTLVNYPRVRFAVLASLASPLVELLGSRCLVLDYAGPAGTGKTSLLKAAASVWGNPDEVGGKLVKGWSTTTVGIERTAATLRHVPLFLNDTSKAPNERVVAKVAYDLTEGQGRARGAKDGGRQVVQTWRNVTISTGEKQLVDYATEADAGVRHRVIQFHGEHWQRGRCPDVPKVEAALWAHYGHAASPWLSHLAKLANDEAQLAAVRDQWERLAAALTKDADENSAAGRLGRDVALVAIAGRLAVQWDILPWTAAEVDEAAAVAWSGLKEDTRQVEGAVASLRIMWQWACAHQSEFVGQRESDMSPPSSGWAGVWRMASDGSWDILALNPGKVREVLEPRGYKYDSALKEWADKGWLDVSKDGRTKLVKQGKTPIRMVCIRRAAVDAVEGGED